MRNDRVNDLVKVSFDFALAVIEFRDLLEDHKKYVIARQLLKSGTSIGAYIREAQSAESKADFIDKMKIAAKEADETGYSILLCQNSLNYPNCENLQTDGKGLLLILSKIIGTSEKSISKFPN